eukprot:5451633-Prymnesium_polylepis.1
MKIVTMCHDVSWHVMTLLLSQSMHSNNSWGGTHAQPLSDYTVCHVHLWRLRSCSDAACARGDRFSTSSAQTWPPRWHRAPHAP